MSLLAVEGLTVRAGTVPVVDGIDFQVGSGEVLALVGESGSGKTAAGRAMLGLLPPGLVRSAGRVLLDGEDLAAVTPTRLRQLRGGTAGMVFQEPMSSLNPAMTVGAQLGEALALHRRLSRIALREACLAMLHRVQIRDPEATMRAYPHEFSGGMRQRIMLAAVMLPRPRLLIADEPTTALDTLTQAEILTLMLELARQDGTAILLITHNLGLVLRHAGRVLIMQRGRIVEQGTAASVLAAPAHPYTRALLEALPRRTHRPAPDPHAAPVLEASGLSVTFGARGLFRRTAPVRAVDGVDLVVRAGETVAVVGGSGSGKTTLGRAMLHLVPSKGSLRFLGREVLPNDRAFRLACQIVFQDPYASLNPRLRVGASVVEPLNHEPGLDAATRARRASETLEAVGLPGMERRFPHQLSGGQRQRVAIARAIVRHPALVVADEPVSALDMTMQKQVLALIARLQRERGFACLFISHDLAAVAEVADRIVVMQAGRIVEQGTRDDVLDAPRHPYTRALLAASPPIPVLNDPPPGV